MDSWYLGYDNSPAEAAGLAFGSYFVLFSFLIPVSMMVTLELVKVIQAKRMVWVFFSNVLVIKNYNINLTIL